MKIALTPFYLIAAALVGIADTLYLSYYAFFNTVPSCAIGGCEIVLTSVYSKFLGIPLGYLGFVYYAYMLALAVLLVMEPRSRALSVAVLGYTFVGVSLSAIFELYIQGVLIGHFCIYCGLSALTTLVLFSVAVRHWLTRTK